MGALLGLCWGPSLVLIVKNKMLIYTGVMRSLNSREGGLASHDFNLHEPAFQGRWWWHHRTRRRCGRITPLFPAPVVA